MNFAAKAKGVFGLVTRLSFTGQTKGKKQKTIHRLAPAPPECPQCQKWVDQLQTALDEAFAAITAQDIRGWFGHSGYGSALT